ncbi:MAG: hypothetical protein JWN08_2833, partial [Frankiales bacterium]|nr:hypothetical protein [Frankiales bacterium]
MSRNTQALKRLGVPSLAAITLVGGLPLFMGTAQAAHVAAPLTSELDNSSVAAGACEPFLVSLPPTGTQTTVGEDVNVVLTSTGNSATFNASFCTLPLTTGGDTFTPVAGVVVRNG